MKYWRTCLSGFPWTEYNSSHTHIFLEGFSPVARWVWLFMKIHTTVALGLRQMCLKANAG